MTAAPIVVTGSTGLIAKHSIAELLKRGYAVRGTLRRMDKADDVRRAVARAGADPARLTFAVADLLSDAGWDDALSGAELLLHTASPFPMQQPDDPDEVIRPAREGTLRVLQAATRAGIKRAAMTSSTVAILYGSGLAKDHVYSEADFTDETRPELTPYIRSKTLAEKAAWDFVKTTPGAPLLTAINPGFVHGPALDADLSTSHELFRLMARGVYPAAPKIRFPVADVRDVAKAHAEALFNPRAIGERFLIADGLLGLYDLGVAMARELPDLKSKAPKFELPDFAVRALAVADKRLRTVLPELGVIKRFSNDKAKSGLGLALAPAEQAVRDSILSLRELRLI
jgi:nucleoside-diphosphate-sugar epimerase